MREVLPSEYGATFVEDALVEKEVVAPAGTKPYFIEVGDPNDTTQPPAHYHTANTIQLFGVRDGETLDEALRRLGRY
jgi:hypothetical protein